jgi:hypothetical protein
MAGGARRCFHVLEPMVPTIRTPADARERLQSLAAWRWGALAAGAVATALWAGGQLVSAVGAVGVTAAVLLAVGAEIARHVLLDEWTLRDDLVELPELARARQRMVADGRRRATARSLRAIALERTVSRHAVAPLLVTRLAPVRGELLAVAEELEHARGLDPRTMAEITVLISDGARSPLLNAAVPETELAVALRRIRFRLATGRTAEDLRPAA